MSSVNKFIVQGRLGQDPELRYAGENPVLNLNLATSESFKTKSGEWKETTEWHKVVVWGKQAEFIAERVQKGTLVYAEGSIKYGSYEKDGNKIPTCTLSARDVKIIAGGVKKGNDVDELLAGLT